jgi:hypothetical protein
MVFKKGHIVTKEIREKISNSHRGLPSPMKGKNHTEETRKKISERTKGKTKKPFTQEHKENMKKNHVKHWISKKRRFCNNEIKNEIKKCEKCYKIKPYNEKRVLCSRIRLSFKYLQWREEVLKRDNWTCQLCGINQEKHNEKYLCDLNVHHKKTLYQIVNNNNISSLNESLFCVELWDISNGITVCNRCHKIIEPKFQRI